MAKSKWSYGKNRQTDTEIRLTYYFGQGTTQQEISEIVEGTLQEAGLERYATQDTPPLAINIPATEWNDYRENSPNRHILTVAIPEYPNPHYSKDKSIPQAVLFFRNYERFSSVSDGDKQRYSALRDKITNELEEKVRVTREHSL